MLGGDNAGLELVTCLASKAVFLLGRMHSDRLTYITGKTDRRRIVWDLKTQAVARTLEVSLLWCRIDFPGEGGQRSQPSELCKKTD